MSVRKVLPIVLVSGIVMLAVGAVPRTGTAYWSAAERVTNGVAASNPAPASISSGMGATQSLCQVLSPPIDIRVDHGSGPSEVPEGVAYNPLHEEYLVVWSIKQGPLTMDIWAARVRGDGSVSPAFNVASGAAEERFFPDVAYSPRHDEYLVVYTYEASATDDNILGTRVSWNGGWKSPEFIINDDADLQISPVIVYNPEDDEYLVVYEQYGLNNPPYDIAAQRVRASDGKRLYSRIIAGGTGQTRGNPDVAYNMARNEYLVVYDYRGNSTEQVRGKLVSQDIGTLGPEEVICDSTVYSSFPQLAAGPDEYLVVWAQQQAIFNDTDAYGRRVDGDGIPQGDSTGFEIAGKHSYGEYSIPSVAYAEGRGYLVGLSYTRYNPYVEPDVLGRYVMPEVDAVMGELFPLFDGPLTEVGPCVTCAPHGDCLVAMAQIDDTGAGDFEIRGRFLWGCPRVYLPTVVHDR
jgi:hypothetical protein